MKRSILIAILLSLTIWSKASVNVIIVYTLNDKMSEKSAIALQSKFTEIYPGATIGQFVDMQSIIKAFNISSDTLIFYFAGHSNRIDEPEKYEYMGKLVMVLDWDVLEFNDMKNYLLVSKSLHYLLNKNTAGKKLVIIDGCYAQAAYNKDINTSWLFATSRDKGSLTTRDENLFSMLFCRLASKYTDLEGLSFAINEELQDKRYYPEYNSNLVYASEYQKENPHLYPIVSISINNFKF